MRFVPQVLLGLLLFLTSGCSGGGGGGGATASPGTGASARPWAIDDGALTGSATDLLVGGDRFIGDLDPVSAAALGDQMWAVLAAGQMWVADNPIYTYRFYDDVDPITNWGRAFRYTGFDVIAGPIVGPPSFYGTGTYVSAAGEPFDAVILRTWDESYWELFVIQNQSTIVHAIQHVNGLPIVRAYASN
ncbi:MAG: hypothetical protein AAFP22_09575 [Planctomycetota bacterium]